MAASALDASVDAVQALLEVLAPLFGSSSTAKKLLASARSALSSVDPAQLAASPATWYVACALTASSSTVPLPEEPGEQADAWLRQCFAAIGFTARLQRLKVRSSAELERAVRLVGSGGAGDPSAPQIALLVEAVASSPAGLGHWRRVADELGVRRGYGWRLIVDPSYGEVLSEQELAAVAQLGGVALIWLVGRGVQVPTASLARIRTADVDNQRSSPEEALRLARRLRGAQDRMLGQLRDSVGAWALRQAREREGVSQREALTALLRRPGLLGRMAGTVVRMVGLGPTTTYLDVAVEALGLCDEGEVERLVEDVWGAW